MILYEEQRKEAPWKEADTLTESKLYFLGVGRHLPQSQPQLKLTLLDRESNFKKCAAQNVP